MKLKKVPIEATLIVPVLVFLFVFYIFPLIRMLNLSVIIDGSFSLKEYGNIFKTGLYSKAFISSIKTSVLVTILALLIGYPFAYFTTYSKHKLLLFGVVAISMWLGIIIRSFGWIGVLGDGGALNYLINFFNIPTQSMLYNRAAVVIGMTHILLPYMVLPLFAVMSNIPQNILRSSKSLGATNFYTFLKVYFPLSLPGILAGSLLVFIQSIGFYITPALLGGKDETMIAQLIEIQMNDLLNWPLASALAITLLCITVFSLFISSKFVPLELLWGGNNNADRK